MPDTSEVKSREPSSKKDAKTSSEKPRKPKSSSEIQQQEWDKFVADSVTSHAGWLRQPITSLATISEQLAIWIAPYLAIAALPILLAAPASWIPHIASPITLLIPIQNSLRSIALETKKGRGDASDSAQWAMYWTVWCILNWFGGWIAVFRPGWRALWEIWRAAALVIVGGPWFGRASLRSPGRSKELSEALKREEVESAKRQKEEAKKEDQGKQKAEAESKGKSKGSGSDEDAKRKAKAEHKAKEIREAQKSHRK